MPNAAQSRSVLLVGSVPLASAEAVFTAVSESIGDLTSRIPDGETGERLGWITWTRDHMRKLPAIETIANPDKAGPRFRLKDRSATIDLGPLQYAPVAKESYAKFRALKAQGRIAKATRFQVSLPTPFGLVFGVFPDEELLTMWRHYENRMLAEIASISEAVPADELALQWDIAIETFGILEYPPKNSQSTPMRQVAGVTPETLATSIGNVSSKIPPAIELGLHICYGDRDGRHAIEPTDLGVSVAFSNQLFEKIRRPVTWVHMPVPIDRDDEAYFAPLEGLRLPQDTTLYLGLVHLADGLEGTARRMKSASRFIRDFGISTECGLGRRPTETIPALLTLHRDAAALSI